VGWEGKGWLNVLDSNLYRTCVRLTNNKLTRINKANNEKAKITLREKEKGNEEWERLLGKNVTYFKTTYNSIMKSTTKCVR